VEKRFSDFPKSYYARFKALIFTIMMPDAALELSVEQLIAVLNKKLFMECTQVQAAVPPASRILVAALAAEVRPQDLKGKLQC